MSVQDDVETSRSNQTTHSFDSISAELKILIISLVDWDPTTFRSQSLLNRKTLQFLEEHEFALIRNVVRYRERLAEILALPSKQTYRDYLVLQTEGRSLCSSILIVKTQWLLPVLLSRLPENQKRISMVPKGLC